MEKNWIDPIAVIRINVKGSEYVPGLCQVSVPYLELLGSDKDTAVTKYHGFHRAIQALANKLGNGDVKDNQGTHEFYFAAPSITLREIENEVNRRKSEIRAPVVSPGSPESFVDDFYPVLVEKVSS